MTLKTYRKKRAFDETSEPKGAKSSKNTSLLHFVIQKHDARRLHYDFRLEYKGVLLSWAIPKEPSEDTSVKRLAIQVEDHPLEYRHFEGTIPEGNYGAGTVEIWDKGTYTSHGQTEKKAIEKEIAAGLAKGHLEFTLDGERLHGTFNLVKLKNSEKGNEWLFIKGKDTYTNSAPTPKTAKESVKKKSTLKNVKPMLATLVDKPFNDKDWIFEIKWDGYRALAYLDGKNVNLVSRNEKSFNERYSTLVSELKNLNTNAVLDGEIVVQNKQGRADFQSMQNYQRTGEGTLIYYVFDLLSINGKDLRQEPLIKRKEILKEFLSEGKHPHIVYNDHIVEKGTEFFKKASEKDLEGIIGKYALSTYEERRSTNWVKIKHSKRQEFLIGGFTQPKGGRKNFGALLIGIHKGNDLIYTGHVGGGFDTKLLEEISKKLTPLIQAKCPFKNEPKTNTPATWVKPKMICEVSYAEWTSEGILRQPIFQGLRSDKSPDEVTREMPKQVTTSIKKKVAEFTNQDKIYYPKEKYTKGDVLGYYEKIAPFILPYLKDRPIVMRRYPNGINSDSFVQKDLIAHPDWIETYPVQHEGKVVNYLSINNAKSLLYAVNLGSIEIHAFNTTYENLEHPTFCVIDLDPENISFDAVVEAAQVVHEILESVGIASFCKTSGATGLHIYIPLHEKYTIEQSHQFAKLVAYLANQQLPKTTSIERMPSARQKRVYLDFGQNNRGQTLVSAYSLRAKEGATVSTPLDWKEVKKGLDPKDFNIKTIFKRIEKKGDLFKGVLGKGVNLGKALEKLEAISGK